MLALGLSAGAVFSISHQESESGVTSTPSANDGEMPVTHALTGLANSPLPYADLAADPGTGPAITEARDGIDASNSGLVGGDNEQSYRTAVFSQGLIYLRGRVPSEEIAAAIVEKASAVLGPDRVINEYQIDPEVPFDSSVGSPLYVEDLVLFDTASAEIEPAFRPLLDLGVLLMLKNPGVTITVIGHTDANGDENLNLRLSKARVQAVLDYWILAGIDPTRVTAIGKGEASPAANNETAQGRQTNRRVEFIISGLLD